MADTQVTSITSSSFYWRLANLSSYWDDNYYQSAVLVDRDYGSSTAGFDPAHVWGTIYPPASGTSYDTQYKSESALSNTTYTVYGYAQSSNGTYYTAGNATFTTKLTTPSSPTIDYRVEGGYKLSWTSVSGATSYTLKVRRGYDNYTQYFTTSNTYYTVTGLDFGIAYHVSVMASSSSNSSSYSSENQATTAPQTPTISKGTVTDSSIEILTGSINGSYDAIRVYRNDANNVNIDYKDVTENSNATWTGLTGGTTYIFKARTRFYINSTTLWSVDYSSDLTVKTGSSRPVNWEWSTTKTSGNDFNLTATEWNGFTTRINEFRTYKGLADYAFTMAYSGNDFTATMFNQARTAINEMSPPTAPPSSQSIGNTVFASLLNNIRDSLNSIQ